MKLRDRKRGLARHPVSLQCGDKSGKILTGGTLPQIKVVEVCNLNCVGYEILYDISFNIGHDNEHSN